MTTIDRKTVEDCYYVGLDAESVMLNTSGASIVGKLLGWDGQGVITQDGSAVIVTAWADFNTIFFTVGGVTYTLPSMK